MHSAKKSLKKQTEKEGMLLDRQKESPDTEIYKRQQTQYES